MTTVPSTGGGPGLEDDTVLARTVSEAIDHGQQDLLRSLEQLAAHAPLLREAGVVERLRSQLQQHPDRSLSPWLTLSYYRIGRHLDAGGDPARLPVPIAVLIDQIENPPPAGTVLAFADAGAAPAEQWAAMLALFQEGGDFVTDLEGPAPEDYVPLAAGLTEARGLLRSVDADLTALMDRLLPLVVLAQPGPRARAEGRAFGGATTFFFRGGSVVNARPEHTLATLLEVSVHEYAHAELFVLGQEQHLCLNDDHERHAVRIRQDPRPMHGILHALHVSSRVARCFERLLAQGLPWRSDRDPLLSDIAALRDNAISNGRSCLEAARRHGRLTPLGMAITAAAAHRLGDAIDATERRLTAAA